MPTTHKIRAPHVDSGYSHQHGYQGDEAANQTFPAGNLISPDANGKYAATAAGAAAATARNRIALAPGQNSANPRRRTEFADPNEFGVLEINAGGATATAALLKPGTRYGYAIDGSGVGYLNLADTTNQVFEIVGGPVETGAAGDTNPRVKARILPAAR